MSLMAIVVNKILKNNGSIGCFAHTLDTAICDFEYDGVTKEHLSHLTKEIEKAEKNIAEIKEWISKANQIIDAKGNAQVTDTELIRALRRER